MPVYSLAGGEIVVDPGAAMSLNRPVDDLTGHVRRHYLDRCNLAARDPVADAVYHVGGLEREQARLFDQTVRFSGALVP